MKCFNSYYGIAGCVLALGLAMTFASCDRDDDCDCDNNIEPVEEQIKVRVDNSTDFLNALVTNYKRQGGMTAARAARVAPQWTMPDLAQVAASADYQLVNGTWPDMNSGGTYVIPEGTEYVAEWGLSMNSNNTHRIDLVVLGKLTVKSNGITMNGNTVNIYVGPNGEIEDFSKDWQGNPTQLLTTAEKALYLYDGAKVNLPLNSYNGAKLYVEGNLTTGDLNLGGPAYIGGTLAAANLTTNNADFVAQGVAAKTWTYNNDSKVYVQYEIDVEGDVTINAQNVAIECQNYLVGGKFHMENNSVLYAYEHLGVQDDCEVSTQGIVYTPCLYVKNKLYIKNCATLNIPNYIYCGSFEASASGFAINMGGDALINAGSEFTIQNKNWSISFDNDQATTSAIVADKFQIMEGEAAYISGYAFLSAAEYWGKPSENKQYYVEGDSYDNYNLQETVKATINGVTVQGEPTNCTPQFTVPGTTPTPPTITELVSSITPHTHDISATCVAMYNGKAYLSWHKRGTSIHGCLEALLVEDDMSRLTSWMEVETGSVEGGDNWGGNSAESGADANGEEQGQYDFNHLVVAEGNVVTVGDNKKMGGFIGAIALNATGDFGTTGTAQEGFKTRQLLSKVTERVARSGNTVLYANGKYYIACAGGFQEYKGALNDLFMRTDGKWNASLGDYTLTDGSAKHIAINPAGDKVATLELTSRKLNEVGDDYWFNDEETAIGAKLKVRDANNWLNTIEWEANIGDIAPIYGKNAIAMDATGNVYVSAGKQGLLVYNGGNKVGQFSIADQFPTAGANGVAIDSKYVYVAYGLGGLWILNKSDLSVVSWYKSNAPEGYATAAAAASANYVALDGNYIYVAYGRHGVKVLKLND